MRGSAYLMILFLIFLSTLALEIGLVSRSILRLQREALVAAKQEYQGEAQEGRVLYSRVREKREGGFVMREEEKLVAQGRFATLEREIWARGEVPLSLFPDLKLDALPPSRDFLRFLGKFKVEPREGYFVLRGRRRALYFPYSVRVKVGRRLIVNNRVFPKLPLVADGDCYLEGRGSLYLLCAGRVFIKAELKGSVVASSGEGFLQDRSFRSWVKVEALQYEGEIMGREVLFKGRGTFKGSLQAVSAQGDWLHIKRGKLIKDFPVLYFLSYAFCYRERERTEVEE